jgi:thioesterase domain-containing protein
MVAGVGGHVFAFHKFSRLLDANQPSYGVKAIGVDGTRPPPERVEDIAAEYVREMVQLRPQGPFVLAGYSLGAVIAFEVALQLRARGLPVPLLIAFDAAAPGYLNYSVWKRLRLHFANLFLRGGGWSYLKQRMRNLRDKLNWALNRGHRNAPTIAGLEMYSQDAITQVWVALHKAYKVYRPVQQFDGSVLVLRADVVEDWDKYVSADPQLGWGRWTTGPIETHGLPVRHLDLFHEPAIFETARVVDAALRRIAGQ